MHWLQETFLDLTIVCRKDLGFPLVPSVFLHCCQHLPLFFQLRPCRERSLLPHLPVKSRLGHLGAWPLLPWIWIPNNSLARGGDSRLHAQEGASGGPALPTPGPGIPASRPETVNWLSKLPGCGPLWWWPELTRTGSKAEEAPGTCPEGSAGR